MTKMRYGSMTFEVAPWPEAGRVEEFRVSGKDAAALHALLAVQGIAVGKLGTVLLK
jgi:hypothetical protein